ncbi:transcription factor bHLH25-like [Vicia villosa]|uniref:transcription factor bHLH25-like n=1 Tax=Vicia villosa TaxID=3911 RepID=UPI00273ADD14|nr:transcription factor bHLH25-like [Vicia villosa]
MEESGENWPSDSDLGKWNDAIFEDGESEYVWDDESKLKERFLALSEAIGSKKMDRNSILVKARQYVKKLQKRVKELEQDVESNVSSNNICRTNANILPDVRAKVLEKEVLVTIHCEKQKNVVLKILTHLENLHLLVVSSNVLQFGTFTIHITIVAQMCDGCSITMDELVKSLIIVIMAK